MEVPPGRARLVWVCWDRGRMTGTVVLVEVAVGAWGGVGIICRADVTRSGLSPDGPCTCTCSSTSSSSSSSSSKRMQAARKMS